MRLSQGARRGLAGGSLLLSGGNLDDALTWAQYGSAFEGGVSLWRSASGPALRAIRNFTIVGARL